MHQHLRGYSIVSHPRIIKLIYPQIEIKFKDDGQIINFFKERISFIYPRSLLLRLDDESEDNLLLRQKINFNTFLNLIYELIEKKEIGTLILDYSNVSIVYPNILDDIICRLRELAFSKSLLLIKSRVMKDIFNNLPQPLQEICFEDISEAIGFLRKMSFDNLIEINMPEDVTIESLNRTLIDSLYPECLHGIDTLRFNFESTKKIEFYAICMLPIIIHSSAHSNGSLVDIILPKYKSPRSSILQFRILHILKPFLIRIDSKYANWAQMPKAINWDKFLAFGVVCFSKDEVSPLVYEIKSYLKKSFEFEQKYVFEFSYERGMAGRSEYFKNFIETQFELIDNAISHSGTISYCAFYYDNIEKCVKGFIGDFGIGLKNGILQNYDLEIPDDVTALRMAFLLARKSGNRKLNIDDPFNLGAGFGLERVRNRIRKLSGSLFIRSGTAMANFSNLEKINPEIEKNLSKIDGVQIGLKIPLSFTGR